MYLVTQWSISDNDAMYLVAQWSISDNDAIYLVTLIYQW